MQHFQVLQDLRTSASWWELSFFFCSARVSSSRAHPKQLCIKKRRHATRSKSGDLGKKMCRQRLPTGVRERGGGAIRRRRRSANRLQSARSLMSVAGTNEYRYITASYSAYAAVQLINNHVWCSIHTFMPHPISMFMCPFSRSYSRSACKLEFAYNSFLVFRKGVGR